MKYANHPCRLLEFDKLLHALQQYTLSPLTAQRFNKLPILTTSASIKRELASAIEIKNILIHEAAFPLEVIDIRKDLEIAKIPGRFLEADGLARIAAALKVGRDLRSYLQQRQETYPGCWSLAQNLTTLKTIEQNINEKIDRSEAIVKSSASPELNRIRKDIARMEGRAKKELDRLFAKYSERGFLQDSGVTLRDSQLVFPVKIEHKGRVRGSIRDQSSSGATLFIEPAEAMDLNNELKILQDKERHEVEKILRELTVLVYNELAAIKKNHATLIEFDFIHAKAGFARDFDCHQPSFNEQGRLEISGGRHPLLLMHKDKSALVVPLDFRMDKETSTLIISGPNAGGKSVTLKTVGLFVLMAQSGIPIPANPDSTFPVFDEVFADIGDSQSIENDLSTFTSHLRTICFVLSHSSEHSLVLLDEIGSATDPAEGAALSIAVLQHLTNLGCKTVVTTHHAGLKVFASNTANVQNGSLEFDARTLSPTYRFKVGVPGSSYALEISRRIGLQEPILQAAKDLLGSEKNRVEDLIIDLEAKTQEVSKQSQQLELEKVRLAALTKLYSEKIESHKKEAQGLKRQAIAESQKIIGDSNRLIEQAIKEIKESHADSQTVSEARKSIVKQAESLQKRHSELTADLPGPTYGAPELELGKQVLWQKLKRTGPIVALDDDASRAMVQFENMKAWVPVAELVAVPAGTAEAPPASRRVNFNPAEKKELLPQIDVRGQLLEDAVAQVDKFLDDALLAGWSQVRIIHGKGTGALRKGLSKFFEQHPRVKQQQAGAWNEGDIGVTIVGLD